MLARCRALRYLRSKRSTNADRDCFDPAGRSTPARRSFDSVIDVFSFMPSSYYCLSSAKFLLGSLPAQSFASMKSTCKKPKAVSAEFIARLAGGGKDV